MLSLHCVTIINMKLIAVKSCKLLVAKRTKFELDSNASQYYNYQN